MRLLIENVRTFCGRHDIPIRPLTVLTGENSSGKTTLLACLSSVAAEGFPFEPELNEEPYRLGTFDLIASKAGHYAGNTKQFSLGCVLYDDSDNQSMKVVATFGRRKRDQIVLEASLDTPLADVTVEYSSRAGAYRAKLTSKRLARNLTVTFPFNVPRKEGKKEDLRSSIYSQLLAYTLLQPGDNASVEKQLLPVAAEMASSPLRVETSSVAPMRIKPWRTYDPADEYSDPEGEHIPFVLARTFAEKGSEKARELRIALTDFGRESGLFDRIEVQNLGKKGSAPFQIQVIVSGKAINLQDVGYGVSQSLPIIVESVLAQPNRELLIQQPEVHLHPMAQAALGSFFARLTGIGNRQFVLETHSDYLVDRIRQEVARRTISPESVVILYFERTGLESTVYQLELDPSGNIVGAPPTYREFFLREHLSLLGR